MNGMVMTYVTLVVAIVAEVIGTTYLQRSEQFTRLVPTALMALFYLLAFYFLSHALRYLPMGIAYAIWSGLGIVLISAVGYFLLGQRLDMPALLGLGLIIAGVAIINIFSKSVGH